MFKLRTVDYMAEPVPQIPNKTFSFIWYFCRQMKLQLFVIMILFGLSNLFVALIPYYIQKFVQIFENVPADADITGPLLYTLLVFSVLVLIIQPILAQAGNWLQAKTMPRLTNLIRRQVAVYMHHHSYNFYLNDFAGRLAAKVVETPSAISEVIRISIGAFWYSAISFVVAVFLFMNVHWSFSVIMGAMLLLYSLLLWYFIPQIKMLNMRGADARSVVRGRYVDILTNILTVKLFARSDHEDQYLLESLSDTAEKYEESDLKLFQMYALLEVLSTLFWVSIILAIIPAWNSGLIKASDVALLLPLTFQLTNIIWWMSEIFTNFFQKLGEIQEGISAITHPHTVTDKNKARRLKVSDAVIRFDNVCFQYGDKPVVENMNLTIKGGEKVGLIGASGAGKSSLVNILLRLYDIQDGVISIDGQNISKVKQDSLRENIATIPQASDLLHRTLRENIRYGNLKATDKDIIAAAKKAHAHSFIMDLRDKDGNKGYDAVVGERGVRLSGGQRQRIAIARAILKNAPILILDEATSALDSESEFYIQESLKNLMKGKTVIAIAHRLSTIAHLDRLIVMDQGKIVEDGSHDELLKQNGVYAKLWSMQSGGFLGD